ncbi:unnamed protein product [Nyctereutes procyonoides]|uniref:(raccoon dog) hypothetical protein n=1 Tax=Nyctereutes procyonoides TaxID=34880 RepID=A0A811ZQ40_NYCPR|nr:unnamed protein product [Nyctereutes procyonoides]
MEKAKGKKGFTKRRGGGGRDYLAGQSQPVLEEAKEKQQAYGEPKLPGTSSSGTKRKRSMKEGKASCSEKTAQESTRVRIRKKIPVPPLPLKLPPANLLHQDILWAWCQELQLSTKGQKLNVYKRTCEYAYPDQKKNFPVTAEEAKILTQTQRRLMMEKGLMSLESPGTKIPSDGTYPPEGVNTVAVTTLAPDSMFAYWSRIAARAGKMETVASPQEAHGAKWCVVHGRSMPAGTEGWVHLQFHAGQTWVPEKQGRVCALFLLPACNFPPP